MKNDILMFHNLMKVMPLHREMSVAEICHAVEGDGSPFVETSKLSVCRALQNDEDVYFEHSVGDRWKRVKEYKQITFENI